MSECPESFRLKHCLLAFYFFPCVIKLLHLVVLSRYKIQDLVTILPIKRLRQVLLQWQKMKLGYFASQQHGIVYFLKNNVTLPSCVPSDYFLSAMGIEESPGLCKPFISGSLPRFLRTTTLTTDIDRGREVLLCFWFSGHLSSISLTYSLDRRVFLFVK